MKSFPPQTIHFFLRGLSRYQSQVAPQSARFQSSSAGKGAPILPYIYTETIVDMRLNLSIVPAPLGSLKCSQKQNPWAITQYCAVRKSDSRSLQRCVPRWMASTLPQSSRIFPDFRRGGGASVAANEKQTSGFPVCCGLLSSAHFSDYTVDRVAEIFRPDFEITFTSTIGSPRPDGLS